MKKIVYLMSLFLCIAGADVRAQIADVQGDRQSGHLGIRTYGTANGNTYVVGEKAETHENETEFVDGALLMIVADAHTETSQRLNYLYDSNEEATNGQIIVKDSPSEYGIQQNGAGLTGVSEHSFDRDRASKTLSLGNTEIFRGIVKLESTGTEGEWYFKFYYTGNYLAPVGENMSVPVTKENAGKFKFVHVAKGETYIAAIPNDRNGDGQSSEAVAVDHIHKILCTNGSTDAPYLFAEGSGAGIACEDGMDIASAKENYTEGDELKTGHHRNALFRVMPVTPDWAYLVNYKYQVTDAGLEYMHSDVLTVDVWESIPFTPETNFDFYNVQDEDKSISVTSSYSEAEPLTIRCTSTWPISFTQSISCGTAFPDGTAWHMIYANDDNSRWINYDATAGVANFDAYQVGKGYLWAFRWVKWPNEVATYNMASEQAYSVTLKENAGYAHPENAAWFLYNQDWATTEQTGTEHSFIFLRNGGGFSMAYPDYDDKNNLTTNARLGYNGSSEYGTENQWVIGYNGVGSSDQKNRLVASTAKATELIEEAASLYYPVRQNADEPRRLGAYEATQEEIDAYTTAQTAYEAASTSEESIETVIEEYCVVKPTEITLNPEGLYHIVSKNGVRNNENTNYSDRFVCSPNASINSGVVRDEYRKVFARNTITENIDRSSYKFTEFDALWRLVENADGTTVGVLQANSGMYLQKPDYENVVSVNNDANSYTLLHAGEMSNVWNLSTYDMKVGVNEWGLMSSAYGNDAKWAELYFEEVNEVPLKIIDTNTDGTGYSSLCLPFAVKLADGLQAFYATAISSTEVTLEEITTGVILANMGVLVLGNVGEYALEVTTTDEVVDNNLFIGTNMRTVGFNKDEIYVYAKGYSDFDHTDLGYGFFLNAASLNAVPANKLYIPATSVLSGSKSLSLHIGVETGVDAIETTEEKAHEVYYDLQGRRVLYPANGIFITKSGKKVFIK